MNTISIILLSAVIIAFLFTGYNYIKDGGGKSCCKGCSGNCMQCNKKIMGKV